MRMLSWGVAINGELGQGGLEDAYISSPSPVPFSSVEVMTNESLKFRFGKTFKLCLCPKLFIFV